MRKSERGELITIVSIILTIILVGALGFIAWQSFLQPNTTETSEQEQVEDENREQEAAAEEKTVTSILGDWPVSVRAPKTWTATIEDTTEYNYVTSQFEPAKATRLAHPSGKVSVLMRHSPSSAADGTCGPSSITYLHKEALADSRLVLLEGVGSDEGRVFFLGITPSEVAAGISKDSSSCSLMGIGYIGQDAEPIRKAGVPYVTVAIYPSFVSYEVDAPEWSMQDVVEFLKTPEYLEARRIVLSLEI